MDKLPLVRLTNCVLGGIVLMSAACGDDLSATPQLVNTPQIGITIVAPSAGQLVPTAQPTPASTPTSEPFRIFNVGDVIKIRDIVLTVIGWYEPQGDSLLNNPGPGNKFVAVDLLIINASTLPRSVSSLLQASVKDDTGQRYGVDLKASIATKRRSPDSTLAPGERVRGSIGFEVPQAAKGLQFVFDASVFGLGKVFVDLGNTPSSVQPPSRLEGETDQPVFRIGDVAQAGALYVTVNELRSIEGTTYFQPSDGYRFLVLDVTFENKSSQSLILSTSLHTYLKDITGQLYDNSITALSAASGTSPDGELVAGEKVRGQIAFEVPLNVTGLVFTLDGYQFGGNKVFIVLS